MSRRPMPAAGVATRPSASRVRCLLAVTAVVLGLAAPAAGAVGLGDIQVDSGLNEPFSARIPLKGVAPGDVDTLRAGLAGEATFQREGLERPWLLTRLRFAARAGGSGAHLWVSSEDHIREPALSFIVEVVSGGKVVQRRYDVLLDLR